MTPAAKPITGYDDNTPPAADQHPRQLLNAAAGAVVDIIINY